MRKLLCICLCVLLTAMLAIGVSASSADVALTASVTGDGVCNVSQTVTVHITEATDNMTYPVPGNASSVAVNGAHVGTKSGNNCKLISISDLVGGMVGDCTFTVSYVVAGTVVTEAGEKGEEDRHILTVPMLSGFNYPIESFSFTVTMPAAPLETPGFSSGYYQTSIEKYMDIAVEGAVVTGQASDILKDHETLEMTVNVDPNVFSAGIARMATVVPDSRILWGLFGLCLLFWLVFLRFAPPLGELSPTAPESINAGEIPSVLHLDGGDLSLMLLHWGQLGYVKLYLDRRGQVTVYRQMDMGNERGEFERKCFRALFGGRSRISCGSAHYGTQFRKIQSAAGRRASLRKKGNPKIFAVLCALCGGVTGFYMGLSMGGLLRYVWAVLFALLSVGSGLSLQKWWNTLWSYRRLPLIWYTVQGAFWIVLSKLVGLGNIGVGYVCGQLAAGLALSYQGRRTSEGKQLFAQVMGFRRYLLFVGQEELKHIVSNDGGFFQRYAPYAIAMGIDGIFAGKLRGGQSVPYLAVEGERCNDAKGWRKLLRRTLRAINRPMVMARWQKLLQVIAVLTAPAPKKQRDAEEFDDEEYVDAF